MRRSDPLLADVDHARRAEKAQRLDQIDVSVEHAHQEAFVGVVAPDGRRLQDATRVRPAGARGARR